MPIDERRQEDLAAAVAAYNEANPITPLPRNAARLLIAMFPASDVCQRSLLDLAVDGFAMSRLSGTLRRLVAIGLLSRHRVAGAPDTYRLHLPRAQHARVRQTGPRRDERGRGYLDVPSLQQCHLHGQGGR